MNILQILFITAIGSFVLASIFGRQLFMSSIASGHGNSTIWGILTFFFYGASGLSILSMLIVGLGHIH